MRPIIGAFRGDVSVSGRLSRHHKARGVEMRQNLQALRAAYHGGIGKFSWEKWLMPASSSANTALAALF
jgi:hypothetical protein